MVSSFGAGLGRLLDVDGYLGDSWTHSGHNDEQSSPEVPLP